MNPNELQTLPWTGERYLTEIKGNIELEHLHRYLFAKRLCSGKRVLDIASGEGYGSAMLAQVARHVTGVDIAFDAVEHANKKYQADNLEYRQGSCAAIPLDDHSVDVVVSFETIEHHDQHDAMMHEIKRVLVSGGLLIISCPDKLEYTDRPNYSNPYHVKELYRNEFEDLLTANFKHRHIAGQRIIYGSVIFSESGSSKLSSYEINDTSLTMTTGIPHALYLVALASDSELPMMEGGILEQPIDESDTLRENLAVRDAQIASLHQTMVERDTLIAALYSSTSWQLTSPLRCVARLFKGKF